MLVTFTTDAYPNITMLDCVAHPLLKMMGHSGTVPSAILAADVPAALDHLSAAINAEQAFPPIKDSDSEEPTISMRHRALPLIDLLVAAAKTKSNVIWR